jgi:hypothetical protein
MNADGVRDYTNGLVARALAGLAALPVEHRKDLTMPEGLCAQGRQAWAVIVMEAVANRCTYTGGCTAFYSPAEWQARGEKYGRGAVLVVCHDGGSVGEVVAMEGRFYSGALDRLSDEADCWLEDMTCWGTAVYPCEGAL